MKEHWEKYRDTAIIVVVLAFLVGGAMKGGEILVAVASAPFVIAILMGIGFMLGNDGGHAAKRWVRDVAWPWVKDTAWPWISQFFKS